MTVHASRGPRVLTVGEGLVGYATEHATLRGGGDFVRFVGGAELNVAVALGLLGIDVTWASVLSHDAHGDHVADRVEALGVGTALVRAEGPTGLMFKADTAGGDPDVLQVRGDTAFARHADRILDVVGTLDRFDHLHLTGIPLAVSAVARETLLALLESARAAGLTVSFDPNLRLHLWPDADEMRAVVNDVAARATVVLPGRGEGQLLTGHDSPDAIAQSYLSAGAEEVVVKLGATGAVAYRSDDSARSREFSVHAVDTVGAGDGFAAGYIAAMLTGGDLTARVDQAAAVGALVTTRRGDVAAMPARVEVDAMLRRREDDSDTGRD